ncbi:glycosyltransferase family 4 protein [Candidatus Thioglobus sp.]|jgi:glycosyltransferase involved in cell wall biosynthesis|nr:glycosyltransferase family 4 protein [Candidatus Thioglobus sp.]
MNKNNKKSGSKLDSIVTANSMTPKLIIGIDATNLRSGGGVTHIVELVSAAELANHGITKVIIWGGKPMLEKLPEHTWLDKISPPALNRGLLARTIWQRFKLGRVASAEQCDVLFVPGGSYAGSFRPIVTMSQNLLPFEWRELRRFGWSWLTLKCVILRITQSHTFRRADGLIFLTRYAKEAVMRVIKATAGKTMIVPHGIDDRFVHPPREQLPINCYSVDRPFRVLYVSIIDMYKHQWQVAEAVAQLRKTGIPVVLDMVGPAYSPAMLRLNATLDRIDPARQFVRYTGPLPHGELHARYAEAELCLFASSCENLPNILLEGMASGLPIACSNCGPMPEVLGDAGVYFDPENPDDIARALRELIDFPELRAQMAKASFELSQAYSWRRCASETFGFLTSVTVNAERRSINRDLF